MKTDIKFNTLWNPDFMDKVSMENEIQRMLDERFNMQSGREVDPEKVACRPFWITFKLETYQGEF
jgi:hypothetical protein